MDFWTALPELALRRFQVARFVGLLPLGECPATIADEPYLYP
jgi:hypothetical protein